MEKRGDSPFFFMIQNILRGWNPNCIDPNTLVEKRGRQPRWGIAGCVPNKHEAA